MSVRATLSTWFVSTFKATVATISIVSASSKPALFNASRSTSVSSITLARSSSLSESVWVLSSTFTVPVIRTCRDWLRKKGIWK